MPSRLAENLFWLGRYSERCEDKARLLRATLGVRTNALPVAAGARDLRIHRLPRAAPRSPVFDDVNPLGLRADLQRLGWCAAQARSRLSAENWRAISVMQREFQDAAARQARSARDARCAAAVTWRVSRASPWMT